MSSSRLKLKLLLSALTLQITLALAPTSYADLLDQTLWNVLSSQNGVCTNEFSDQTQLPALLKSADAVEQARLRLIQNLTPTEPILTQPDGSKLDLRNSFFLQYGSNVITEMRGEVSNIAKQIVDRWKSIQRGEQEGLLKSRMTFAQSQSWSKAREFTYISVFPNMKLDDGALFPILDQMERDPEFFNLFKEDRQAEIREIIAKGEPLTTGQTMTVELNLQQDWIEISSKPFFDELKKLGGKVSDGFVDKAAQEAERHSPTGIKNEIGTWYAYLNVDPYLISTYWFKGAPKIVKGLIAYLNSNFPLSEKNLADQKLKSLIENANKLSDRKPKDWTTKLFSPDGLSIEIKSSKLYSRFIPEIGSSILATRSNFTQANPGKPLLVLLHGDGTTRSSLASWRALLGFYEANGFNAVAIDMNELRVKKMEDVITMINRTILHIKNTVAKDNPIVVVGRSMGAQKAVTHASMFDGNNNAVDAYVAMSFSNPDTMEFQTKSVYNQVKAGLFSGLIKESLTSAADISAETKAMVSKASTANPDAFKGFGNKVLLFQGDSDLDGGPTVVQDLYHWRGRYCEDAAIQIFVQPESQKELYHKLAVGDNARLADGTPVDEDMLEGTHFVHSNRENNSAGNPRSQTLQSFASMHAQWDYIADGPAPGKQWQFEGEKKSQKVWQEARAKLCLPGESFFDSYIRHLSTKYPNMGVDRQKIYSWKNPKPNSSDINERFAWSKKIWDEKRQSARAAYQTRGW